MKRFNLSSAAVAALMAAGATAPVFAEGKVYTPVAGTETSFTSTINLKDTAHVPNVTFHYAVSAGAAQVASEGNLAVNAGNDGVTSSGLPTIADVVFTAADAHTDDKISKTAKVDFSGVKFNEPGVYRYVVKESGEAQAISSEEDTTKALDVYVTDDGAGNLVVSGYVMHNDETAKAVQLGETKRLDDKDVDFEHTLTTSDLKLGKTVTGNQGSKDEYFKFTLKITGAEEGAQYTVDLKDADATTKKTAFNQDTHTNPTLITVGKGGNVTTEFWLQHGQSISVLGLAQNTAYDITEDNGSYKVSTSVKEGDAEAVTGTTNAVNDDAITGNSDVEYTNDKSGAVPTGVIMTVAPFAIATVIGGAGIVTMRMKKKDEE